MRPCDPFQHWFDSNSLPVSKHARQRINISMIALRPCLEDGRRSHFSTEWTGLHITYRRCKHEPILHRHARVPRTSVNTVPQRLSPHASCIVELLDRPDDRPVPERRCSDKGKNLFESRSPFFAIMNRVFPDPGSMGEVADL
jgi:hypothetical protein